MADVAAHWAVLVYVAADTPDQKLTQGAWKSLEQLRVAGSSDKVKLLAQADIRNQPTRRFFFPPQPNATATDVLHCADGPELGELNSGDKDTLRQFIQWGQQRCPAKNYMVVLWGHGYGTDDYNPFPRTLAASLPDPHALHPDGVTGPGVSANDHAQDNENHLVAVLASMPDFRTRTLMTNRDVGDALRGVVAAGGKPTAVLGMDACEMSMAEVWLEMLGGASFAVGSEYEMPYSSWPYDTILQRLLRQPTMTPQELAKSTVGSFIESYSSPGNRKAVTLSACDLEQAQGLMRAVAGMVKVLLPEATKPSSRHAIFHARNRTLQFDPHGFIDLRNFSELVAAYLPKTAIKAACKAVLKAFDEFVVASAFAPSPQSKLARAKGLAVYFPKWVENPDYRSSSERQERGDLSGKYAQLVFTQKTGWNRLLLALIEPEEGSPVQSRKEKMMGTGEAKGRKKKKKKPAKKKKH